MFSTKPPSAYESDRVVPVSHAPTIYIVILNRYSHLQTPPTFTSIPEHYHTNLTAANQRCKELHRAEYQKLLTAPEYEDLQAKGGAYKEDVAADEHGGEVYRVWRIAGQEERKKWGGMPGYLNRRLWREVSVKGLTGRGGNGSGVNGV